MITQEELDRIEKEAGEEFRLSVKSYSPYYDAATEKLKAEWPKDLTLISISEFNEAIAPHVTRWNEETKLLIDSVKELQNEIQEAKDAIEWLCANLYELDFNANPPTIGMRIPSDWWFIGNFPYPENVEDALPTLVKAIKRIREES